MMITGTDFYRRKNQLTRKMLAEQSGLSTSSVARLLQDRNVDGISINHFVKAARILGVSIDALLVAHDDRELDGYGYIPPSRTENHENCIAVYRHKKSLTLSILGDRLGGLTKERARQLCACEQPPEKHIRRLAEYEGMTAADFRIAYSDMDEGGAA